MEAPVLFDTHDGIATITLNRPEQGNAIDLALAQALVSAAIRCETDAAIRCVVLTGRGRLFCAGGDLALFRDAGDRIDAVLSELAGTLHMALIRFARMTKPFVVLVNGPAAGAGMSLAIGGDIVIAAQAAHFRPAYGSLALSPDGGMSWLLPRLVGMRQAQEILLLDRRIPADEAAGMGLVTRIVPAEALVAEGGRIAAQLASSAAAAGHVRRLLHQALQTNFPDQLAAEEAAIVCAGAAPECRAALAALGLPGEREPSPRR